MRFYSYSENNEPIRRYFFARRCFLYFKNRHATFEFYVPDWTSLGFSFAVNHGDSNDELQFHVGAGLFSFWLSIPFFRFSIGYWTAYQNKPLFIHEERAFEISWHDGGLWIYPWHDWRGSYGHSSPWWQNGFHFNPMDFFFGRSVHSEKILSAGDCMIPMPEGCYGAKYKLFVSTWKRPRLPFARRLQRITIDVDRGVPHEGKGENSWDCGEDGIFGLTCPAKSLEEGIGKFVTSALQSRKKYGGAHTHRKLATKMAVEA